MMIAAVLNRSRRKGLSAAARRLAAAVSAGLVAVSAAGFTMPKATAQDLKPHLDSLRKSFDPARLPKSDVAKAELQRRIVELEQLLNAPNDPNGQAWLTFLKWDVLKSELAKETPDARSLMNVELNFHQNYDGLQLTPVLSVREALKAYNRALRYGAQPEQTQKILGAILDRVEKAIAPDSAASELEKTRDIGLLLDFLHDSNQAPEVVSAVTARYAFPNVRLSADQSVIAQTLSRPVQQAAPVDECILGTRILGNSCVIGSVNSYLVPNNSGISLCIQLQADFSSNNIGHNRGVKIYTTGSSPICASKLIHISESGVTSQPATAEADLQTTIHNIEHPLKIVRKIASKQAAKQSPEANAIGEARLEHRLAGQFDQQVNAQLAESNSRDLFNQDRPALKRLGIPAPLTTLASSSSAILASFRESAAYQLAAPSVPAAGSAAAVVKADLHQSLPINVADLFLGGRTVHSWEMDDLVRQFTGVVSEELKQESEGEPWSITFADFHPVEVEFEDGHAKIAIRISQMTRGDQALNQGATVSAVYKPVVEDGKLVFVRQGDVQLDFVGQSSGLRVVTLRSFLKGKFEKFFKEKSEPQSIAVQDRFPNAPPLSLESITLDDGWAQVGLK